ncbi:sensor histidine kinase [Streptomyces albireticuli]|uniref:histidine kinase n=1 Tax=Streptomyces albireticuli TaxID=1940 RepID=A0A2A2D9D1_9ACTN|nr:sensor histidine kinase [Streptomyces albireticuli]MCD9141908.1 sensor histidine kinase [Streptomyces albireticuli]MCD9163148.1 sensor histidine kinase [Streptomyces albireticuli]MCD9190082.1 sensor histidine kinase [Streptomyces albireticuli]PAU48124.1 two-component sensor histidine kinase [Streptomyces albireticuli]
MSQSPRTTAPRPSPLAFARDVFTPAGPPTPLLGRSRRRFVRAVAYVLTGAVTIMLLGTTATVLSENYGLQSDIALVLALLQAVPVLLAVRRPLLAWAIVFTADVAGALALLSVPTEGRPWPWPPMEIIGMLLLLLLLGLRERRRTLVAVWTLTAVVTVALAFVAPGRSSLISVTALVLDGVVLVVGGALRERGDARRALAEQETISEAERARRTLLEERTRIARELHDVVAHHMSVITVQADSAPYRLTGLPPEAREEFATIAATARESLTEMRRLLGVLRSEDASGEAGGVERAPQPGVERIPQLVEATVRAGLPVKLAMPDPLPDALPQTVDLSAYRIAQEALANVVRHAPGAATRVSVSVDRDRGGLMVLVVNSAPEAETPPLETSGTGHGLVGMRERVRLVGGTLDTGPLPDGGFRVAARLPFTTEEELPTA